MNIIPFIGIGLLLFLSIRETRAQQANNYDFQKINENAEKVLTDIKNEMLSLKSTFPQLGLEDGTFSMNKYPVGDGSYKLNEEYQKHMLQAYTTARVWRQLVYTRDARYLKWDEGVPENVKPSPPTKPFESTPPLSKPATPSHLVVGPNGIYVSILVISGSLNMILGKRIVLYKSPTDVDEDKNLYIVLYAQGPNGNMGLSPLLTSLTRIIEKDMGPLKSVVNQPPN